jgi:hypothetical protein
VYPVFVLLLLLHCFILYLYCCYVMYVDHHFTVIYLQICVLCVGLVITSTLFYLYTCIVVCCVSRSSLYCNIPSDLCTLCLSCYYFYIVLSLYLYCCYVMYTDHHFTVIYLQICVPCVCFVITSTLFYFILSIKIKQCRNDNKPNTEYTHLKVYYSKVMICIHNITTIQV